MTDGIEIRPFSNGTAYDFWNDTNCEHCAMSYDHTFGGYQCPIEEALDLALFGDGVVSASIAKRMGYNPKTFTVGARCPEFTAYSVVDPIEVAR